MAGYVGVFGGIVAGAAVGALAGYERRLMISHQSPAEMGPTQGDRTQQADIAESQRKGLVSAAPQFDGLNVWDRIKFAE